MLLALLSAGFQSLPLLPTIKLGPSGADSWVSELVCVLRLCGSFQGALLWGWEFLPLPPQPPQVFSIRGLRLYFPVLEPWVVQSVLLPSCSSQFIWMQMWGHPVCNLLPCLSPFCLAACLCPYYWSGWMFLLYILGCQTSTEFAFLSVLVVFLFLNLLLSFFWLCEEVVQCVYLHLHLGRKFPTCAFFKGKSFRTKE